jgi:hypothetical protein
MIRTQRLQPDSAGFLGKSVEFIKAVALTPLEFVKEQIFSVEQVES